MSETYTQITSNGSKKVEVDLVWLAEHSAFGAIGVQNSRFEVLEFTDPGVLRFSRKIDADMFIKAQGYKNTKAVEHGY